MYSYTRNEDEKSLHSRTDTYRVCGGNTKERCIEILCFRQFYKHFVFVEAGVTNKPIKDCELSRYAYYLIVQNSASRKEVIALGQTYFAIQTYRQEVADHFNELSEDNRRLDRKRADDNLLFNILSILVVYEFSCI